MINTTQNSICLGLMFSCLDTSIVSTALVSVSIEFQNYQDIPWTVLGYLLTYMSELEKIYVTTYHC